MKKENAKINETISREFSLNAAGINWKAKHDNYRPLVEASQLLEEIYFTTLKGDEPLINHLVDQLRAIAEHIDAECTDELDENLIDAIYPSASFYAPDYKIDLAYLWSFIDTLETNPSSFDMACIYELILDYWPILANQSITYRALADMSSMANWESDNKYDTLIPMCIEAIHNEWLKEEPLA